MAIKKTSEQIVISFGVSEPAPNTFTQEEIALQLDILNNEVFVVQAIDLDTQAPDAVPATNTTSRSSVTTTTQTTIQSLSNSNTLASQILAIKGFAASGVGFSRDSSDAFAHIAQIGIIATNNFFIQVEGSNNVGGKTVTGKLYGYRAKADSATYAGLVQSEVLSA